MSKMIITMLKLQNQISVFFKQFEKPDNYVSFSNYFHKYNFESGRFRPVSVCFLWCISKVADGNVHIVECIIFLFAVSVVSLFYWLLRLSGLRMTTTVVFTLAFMSWRYEQIWFRRTGELFGLFFLFLAFVFLFYASVNHSRRKIFERCTLLSFALSAGCKESFVLLIPACIVISVLVFFDEKKSLREAFMSVKKIIVSLLLVFSVFVAGIFIAMHSETTYSVSEPLAFSASLMTNNFLCMIGSWIWWLPILFFLFFFIKEKRMKPVYVLITLCWFCWLVPQLIFYKQTLLTSFGRYLLPAVIFPLFIGALCTEQLRKYMNGKIYFFLIVLLSLTFFLNAKNVFIISSYYAARAKSYHRMLKEVAEKAAEKNGHLLILVEQGGLYDSMESTVVFLSNLGVNVPVEYFEILNNGNVKKYNVKDIIPYAQNILKTKEADASVLKKELENELVSVVIFTTPKPFSKLHPQVFASGYSEIKSFQEPYFNAGIKDIFNLNFNYSDTISYQILIR